MLVGENLYSSFNPRLEDVIIIIIIIIIIHNNEFQTAPYGACETKTLSALRTPLLPLLHT